MEVRQAVGTLYRVGFEGLNPEEIKYFINQATEKYNE